ncbi:MAG: hypothetical protein RR364_05650 [Lachnospiraceae bacterium]
MSQRGCVSQKQQDTIRKWQFQENPEEMYEEEQQVNEVSEEWMEELREEIREELQEEFHKERRELEQQEKTLQWERMNFKRDQQLFQMKWKILEEELRKLADEKQQLQRESDYHAGQNEATITKVRGRVFFSGVKNELTLKKRYKDLIKIFHPDNVAGDTQVIQEINKEYEEIKTRMKQRA